MSVMQNTHGSTILLPKEMVKLERLNFQKKNSYLFMKKAGQEVFKFIKNSFKNKQSVSVLCGPGNNGGDGFIIAKHLVDNGYKTTVYTFPGNNRYRGDALKALRYFSGITKNINSFKLNKKDLIVDAIFGIGLTRKIKGSLKKIFRKINKSNNFVVSVDIPSGISAIDGKILGSAIKSDFTVTFHSKKIGHIFGHGKEFSGTLKVVDIGLHKKKIKIRFLENSPDLWLKFFPWKKTLDHKYSRGRVVIYGGKKESTGATMLSALAALKTGVGAVKIICSKDTLQIYSLKFPSVLKTQINKIEDLDYFLKREKITSVLIGPGSGVNEKIKQITKLILKKVKYVVLDADALTCFKNDLQTLYRLLDKNKIITPHLGEFHKIFPKIKKNLDNTEKVLHY